MENNQKEHILLLVKDGYLVSLFTLLNIYKLENGQYAVDYKVTERRDTQELFEDISKAVDRFLELKHEKQLGYEYEVET